MSDLPGWDVLDDADEERAPGRGRMLVVAALVPWLVVGAVVLRQSDVGGTPPPTPTEVAEPVDSAAAVGTGDRPSPVASGSSAPLDEPALDAATAGLPRSAGPAQAAGVATLVARAWLSGVGPDLDVDIDPAGTGAYVEQLHAEDISWPAPGSAVVSLVAVLLESDGERYTRARAVRLAVPLRLDARGVRPAGAPWWLPPPDLAPDAPTWRPVDDPDIGATAGEALAAAGYADVAVEAVETSDVWPVRVRATAIAPGADERVAHTVWLREHLGELVVAGAPTEEVTR